MLSSVAVLSRTFKQAKAKQVFAKLAKVAAVHKNLLCAITRCADVNVYGYISDMCCRNSNDCDLLPGPPKEQKPPRRNVTVTLRNGRWWVS
jgi:hypothetical protein